MALKSVKVEKRFDRFCKALNNLVIAAIGILLQCTKRLLGCATNVAR